MVMCPAQHRLEIFSAHPYPPSINRHANPQGSHLFQQNEAHASQLLEECAKEHPPLTLRSKYAASQATQRRWLIRKFCKMYWHLPQYSEHLWRWIGVGVTGG